MVWIPEEFAVLNKYLRIEEENGWQVLEVSESRVSTEFLLEHERDYLKHRSVTDI